MQILIMEDDAPLAKFLKQGLMVEGHDVQIATDGKAGLKLAVGGRFGLIVLDLSLPQMDGTEVLRELRQHSLDASILVLTGRVALSDKVRCLDLGADDFLMKPFSFAELAARCRALVRRRGRYADPLLKQGGLELHRMERKVVRDGRVIELTVKEFALLEYLMLARGRTCSRGELLREVWQMPQDAATNVVDVYVNYLRKKLCRPVEREEGAVADDCAAEGLIATVRGEGYSLGSEVMQGMRKPPTRDAASLGRTLLPKGAESARSSFTRTHRALGLVANA